MPRGGSTSSSWTRVGTTDDGLYEIYEDGTPDIPINALAMTRDATSLMLPDPSSMSDLEESDTEIDYARTEKRRVKKVYRINNLRDTRKLQKVLKANPTDVVGVRTGVGGSVFRIIGETTQVVVKGVAKAKLVQSDKTQALGYKPERVSEDLKPTGSVGSYGALFSPLRKKGKAVGKAIYNKYIKKPSEAYPVTFTATEGYLMDEAFTVLTIAEGFRADYGLPLFVAAVRALIRGESPEAVFYKGKGQLEALHPGASSFSVSKVSGQLMEQNLGLGENAPHPTRTSMNISSDDFDDGARRTKMLFDRATTGGENYFSMLTTHMLPSFTIGARDITKLTRTERASPFAGATVSLRLKGGITVREGDKVIYKKTNYEVKNVTPTGWVQLI